MWNITLTHKGVELHHVGPSHELSSFCNWRYTLYTWFGGGDWRFHYRSSTIWWIQINNKLLEEWLVRVWPYVVVCQVLVHLMVINLCPLTDMCHCWWKLFESIYVYRDSIVWFSRCCPEIRQKWVLFHLRVIFILQPYVLDICLVDLLICSRCYLFAFVIMSYIHEHWTNRLTHG
jgi:hypothetical protein